MSETSRPQLILGLKPWQTILLFSILLTVVTGIGTFFFDFFAGTATVGFGKQPTGEAQGTAMFFVYMIGYFTALILILPMLLIKRFGVATAVYVPFVVLGFPVNYYFEWIVEHTWKSPWSGLGWSVAFLAIGFSADLAYRFLPAHVSERLRAILVGIVIACVSFLGTLVAPIFVYTIPPVYSLADSGSFLGLAYFGLPWLIVNSAFGGYTAYAISRNV